MLRKKKVGLQGNEYLLLEESSMDWVGGPGVNIMEGI